MGLIQLWPWRPQSQPITSNHRQLRVLWPRHHRCQLGRTQNQHVKKAAVRGHHQHWRLLQLRPPTLHPDPQEAHREEDGPAQQPDDGVKEPAPPARDRLRAFLFRQASQSEPSEGPHDEEEERRYGDAKWEEDAAQDDALRGMRQGLNPCAWGCSLSDNIHCTQYKKRKVLSTGMSIFFDLCHHPSSSVKA